MNSRSSIYLLFILSPFLSLLKAFAHPERKWAKNVVWAFFVFFGSTFVIPRETMDAASYRDRLIEAHESNWSFSDFTATLYNTEIFQGETDLLEPSIKWIVSKFTSDYRVLFLFFALIYGYFYSRIIWFVLDEFDSFKGIFYSILIISFCIVSPIWYISGFRWYTALVFQFYFLLQYWKHDRVKYLIFGTGSVLIHYSFGLLIPIILLYLLVKKKLNILFVIFLISQFIQQIDVEVLAGLIPQSILPKIFVSESEAYLSGERAELLSIGKSNKVWYARIYGDWFKWSLIFCLSYIFLNKRSQIMKSDWLLKVFSATFYFFIITTLIQNIPSMGRFMSLAYYCGFLALISYLSLYRPDKRFQNKLAFFAAPGFLLYSSIVFKNGMETFSILTLIGNPMMALFFDYNISILSIFEP